MGVAAEIAAAKTEAWRAGRDHRPATLSLPGRKPIAAKIVADGELGYASTGGRGSGRYSREILVSFVGADAGSTPPTPNTDASITDETSRETTAGRVGEEVTRNGPIWTLTVVT